MAMAIPTAPGDGRQAFRTMARQRMAVRLNKPFSGCVSPSGAISAAPRRATRMDTGPDAVARSDATPLEPRARCRCGASLAAALARGHCAEHGHGAVGNRRRCSPALG